MPRFSSKTANLPSWSTPKRSSGPPSVGVCRPTRVNPSISRCGFSTRASSSICSDLSRLAEARGMAREPSSCQILIPSTSVDLLVLLASIPATTHAVAATDPSLADSSALTPVRPAGCLASLVRTVSPMLPQERWLTQRNRPGRLTTESSRSLHPPRRLPSKSREFGWLRRGPCRWTAASATLSFGLAGGLPKRVVRQFEIWRRGVRRSR